MHLMHRPVKTPESRCAPCIVCARYSWNMGRPSEEPIPVEESYRELLRQAVRKAGGQSAVERLSGVDQGTVSRAFATDARTTYTTLARLQRALPDLPAPIVAVRDARHEAWCRGGGELATLRPAVFNLLYEALLQALQSSPPPGESSDPIATATTSSRVPTLSQRSPSKRVRARR